MVPTTARAALGYKVTGAIGYIRDEQRPRAVGMGLVARFGAHNAGLFVALQKEHEPVVRRLSGDDKALKLMSCSERFRDPGHAHHGSSARWACSTYDGLGQWSDCEAIGLQLDLTA